MPILMTKFALDTNVLIYLFDQSDLRKKEIVNSLFEEKPIISSQVISEFINVSMRLLKIPKIDIFDKCNQVFRLCKITSTSQETLDLAEKLMNKYDFQIFDAIIVASALICGCEILYTEDMQHEQIVEHQLKIINPFM